MRYASLTKLGGELIEADRADYDDYKGFLRCPECGEPVFLRKSHTRQSAQRVSAVGGTAIAVPSQLITVPSAFVHHQAVPEVSVCELRVSSYTEAEVEYRRSVSRDQRLRKLQVSMWKYLKTNYWMNLNNYSLYIGRFNENASYRSWVQKIINFLDNAVVQEYIINDDFARFTRHVQEDAFDYYKENDSRKFEFLKKRRRDWTLHCRIAKEALVFVIKSQAMKEIRQRLICRLLLPPFGVEYYKNNWNVEGRSEKAKEQMLWYISLNTVLTFIMVDWMQVLAES